MSRRRSKRRLEAAVGISEEGDVGDADHLRRGALLGFGGSPPSSARGTDRSKPPASPLGARCSTTTSMPASVQRGDGARAPEVDVVGMGGDDQDPFDVVVAVGIAPKLVRVS